MQTGYSINFKATLDWKVLLRKDSGMTACQTSYIIALCVVCSVAACVESADQEGGSGVQPNIVFIMADYLDWNHLSASNGALGSARTYYHTPHLEQLAASGVSFTHCYAMPNCAPSRAAILTGQYPARSTNGVYSVHHLNRFPKGEEETTPFVGGANRSDIAAAAITLGEALQMNGYTTAHIGKYHVGGHDDLATLPQHQGFDLNIGGNNEGSQRKSCFAMQDAEGHWYFHDVGDGAFDRFAAPYSAAYVQRHELPATLIGSAKHITDAQADAAESVIRQLAAGGKPFYLQLHTYAVHSKVIPRHDLLAEAAGRSMTLPEPVPGATAVAQYKLDRRQEYAAFVTGLDQAVGRVVQALRDPNNDGDEADSILANTIIVFTSDNGGTHDHNAPLKGKKGKREIFPRAVFECHLLSHGLVLLLRIQSLSA